MSPATRDGIMPACIPVARPVACSYREEAIMATIDDLQNIRYSGDLRIDALLDSGPNWNYLNPQRNTLYYTFDIINDVAGNTSALTAFNASQRSAATAILNYVSKLTGIRFQETANGNLADLHFSACDIEGSQVSGLCQTSWSWSY